MQVTSEAPQATTTEIASPPSLLSGEELFRYLRRECKEINGTTSLAIQIGERPVQASVETRKESMTIRVWATPTALPNGRQRREQLFAIDLYRSGHVREHGFKAADIPMALKDDTIEAILEGLRQKNLDLALKKIRARFQETVQSGPDEISNKTQVRQKKKLSNLLSCDPFHRRQLGTNNLGVVLYVLAQRLLSKMDSVTEPLLFQEVKRSVSMVEWGVTEPRFSQTLSRMRQSGILQEVSPGRFKLHPSWQGLVDTPEIQSVQDLLS